MDSLDQLPTVSRMASLKVLGCCFSITYEKATMGFFSEHCVDCPLKTSTGQSTSENTVTGVDFPVPSNKDHIFYKKTG